jgi:CHAT domain-containing protein/tetratricopeptide (TPR) repeat protein
LLDRAEKLVEDQKAEEALEVAGRALAAAVEAEDVPGQALAYGARARILRTLDSTEDAAAAWREAATAWERAGDGPGRIDALCSEAILVRPESADALLDRAVALAREEDRRPGAAIASLNQSSEQLRRIGRVAEAKSLAEAAFELGERKVPDSLQTAGALHALGTVAQEQGDLATARDHYLRALGIRERKAPDSLELAGSFNNLGAVAQAQGDLASARDYQRRALEIRERLAPDSLAVATSLSNLGNIAWSGGDLAAAHGYFRQALEIRERRVPDSLEVAASLNNLGNVAWRQGDLAAARESHLRALEIRERRAPGSLDVARSQINLAFVTKAQGDLAAAYDYHVRALEIFERDAPGSLEVASSLNGLGVVAWTQGDLAAARDYFLRGLETFEKRAPGSSGVAVGLNNLGLVARDQGDFAAARAYLARAHEIVEKQAPGSLDVAISLENLGDVAREQSDVAAARDFYERSLAIREKLAPDSLDVAASLNGLGSLAWIEGDVATARGYHLRALEIRDRYAPESLAASESLYNLGKVAQQGRDPAAALAYLGRSWAIVRRQASAVAGDAASQAFTARFADYARELVETQFALGRVPEAFQTHEEGRAQALLRILRERGLEQRVPDAELWQAYREAESAFQAAGKKLAEAGSNEAEVERDAQGAELEAMRAELATVRAAREHALSAYTQARLDVEQRLAEVKRAVPGLDVEPVALRKAQGELPAGSVFLAFSVGKDKSILFVLSPRDAGSIRAYPLPVAETELEERVASLRQGMEASGAARAVSRLAVEDEDPDWVRLVAASHELFDVLFPQQVGAALDGAKRVIVSPDGPLWELPFAALAMRATGNDPRWLGLEKPLSYVPSLTVFAVGQARERAPAGPEVLVVGDPLLVRRPPGPVMAAATSATQGERSHPFGDDQAPEPLPFARVEASRVARLYDVEPLLGQAATEAAVRARLPRASVVHLATHGYFHPDLALSSGVLLAPPEVAPEVGETANDGALQAWEFGRSLPLNADLVVLSACETGRGERVRGEGLVGLTSSLVAAGARSVVATQWMVADEASAALMVSFHEKLRGGTAKDEALRRAMVETHEEKAMRHPFFWAGFFLVGDPDRPLSR